MCMFGLSEWMHKTWTHDSMNTLNISQVYVVLFKCNF